MIEVDILNCKSKRKKELYEKSTKYFVQALMPRIKHMHIDVCIENRLDADAFCTQIEPKYFIIELAKKLPLVEQIKCIAHEIVHCRQFYSKKLQYKNNKIFWLGKGYAFHTLKRKDFTQDEYDLYLNTPWEVEAYGLETKLYNNFLNIFPDSSAVVASDC